MMGMKVFRVLLFARGSSKGEIQQYLDQMRKMRHGYDEFQVYLYTKQPLVVRDELVTEQFDNLRKLWRFVETPKDQFNLVIVDDMSKSNLTFLLSMLLYRIPLVVEEEFIERYRTYLIPEKTVVAFSRRLIEGLSYQLISFLRNFKVRMALTEDAYRFVLRHKAMIWKGLNWEDDEEPVKKLKEQSEQGGIFRWKKKPKSAAVRLSQLNSEGELERERQTERGDDGVVENDGKDDRQGRSLEGTEIEEVGFEGEAGRRLREQRELSAGEIDSAGRASNERGKEGGEEQGNKGEVPGALQQRSPHSLTGPKAVTQPKDQVGLKTSPRAEYSNQADLIIISYNTLSYLRECILSIRHHTRYPYQIIVVDNGSTDGSVEYLRKERGLTLIENKENYGYARACNQGLMMGKGEFAVILNTDIKVSQGWLTGLIEVAQQDPQIGVVGPKMVNQQNQIVGAGVTQLDAYCSGRGWLTQDGVGVYDQQEDCFSVGGACYLIRREALNKVGAFDEGYFFYFEESDLSIRMIEKGYRVVYAPQVKIIHYHEGSLDARDRLARQKRNIFFQQSQQRFLQKWKAVLNGANQREESQCLVVFGVIPWDFRHQRPQQIYSRLANKGYRILYINNTCYLGGRLNQVGDNIYAFSPDGWGVAYQLLNRPHNAQKVIQSIYEVLQELGFYNPSIWVDVPYWQKILPYFDRQSLVYNCMDSYEEFSDLKEYCPELEGMEGELARNADVIFASSQGLYEKMRGLNLATYLIPNGVDREHFSLTQEWETPAEMREIPKPIIGYYGAIADWFDLELLDYLTSELPKHSFVLIGGSTIETKMLSAKPNVYFLGEKPYQDLPKYVQHFAVALIPFKQNKLTASTNPVKLYEYLATGKPVVSVDLPEVRQFQDVVYIGKDYQEFLFYLEAALESEGWWVKRKRKRSVQLEDWNHRVQDIVELLPESTEGEVSESRILQLRAYWAERGE